MEQGDHTPPGSTLDDDKGKEPTPPPPPARTAALKVEKENPPKPEPQSEPAPVVSSEPSSPAPTKKGSKTASTLGSSSSSSSSSSTTSQSQKSSGSKQKAGNYPCGKNVPPLNCAYCPPRSNAFYAPMISVRDLDQRRFSSTIASSGYARELDDNGSVNFAFRPRPDYGTQVTFSVEPRKQPYWKTMLQCGFVPMINCGVPSTFLTPPGMKITEESSSESSASDSESESSYSEESSSGEDDEDDSTRGGTITEFETAMDTPVPTYAR